MNRREFLGLGASAAAGIAVGKGIDVGPMSVGCRILWTNPYITDGLVAMWDGEWNAGGGKHDDSASTWVNLGSDSIATADVIDGVWGDSFMEVAGGSSPKLGASVSFAEKEIGPYTIECVCMVNRATVGVWERECFFLSEYSEVSFDQRPRFGVNGYDAYTNDKVYRWRNINYITGAEIKPYSLSGVFNHTPKTAYVANDSIVRVNGTIGTYANSGYTTSRTKGILSLGATNTNFAMRVFCIRYYGRALTAEEVAANYAIDARRFGL